jgi:hypothetical protein
MFDFSVFLLSWYVGCLDVTVVEESMLIAVAVVKMKMFSAIVLHVGQQQLDGTFTFVRDIAIGRRFLTSTLIISSRL